MASKGRFIVIEGGEASGKSTQANRLAAELGGLLTREPGGTAVGERLRAILLDPALPEIADRAEALMMLAARAQHVAEVIVPALEAGQDVICDRFAGSTLAYQGYGRGLAPGPLAEVSAWAANGLRPDRVILLQVPAPEAAERLHRRGGTDRLEGESAAFFARVGTGFATLAAADPVTWRAVDGVGSTDEVAGRVVMAAQA
ncbi:MAG: dTMP kinase [Actinomycetota bacterium]|nr:dTMP kinase [Actinomycetota bacterium]